MTRTFSPPRPIWCAGCGDFGVLEALISALSELGVPTHERMKIGRASCRERV